MLEHTAHRLPAQAPLEVFVHHNTLHAFQHLPFHEALDTAREKLGVQGYLPEERYQEAFRRGRITDEDLEDALARYLTACTPSAWPEELPPRRELARWLLVHPCEAISQAGLLWEETERQATTTFASGVEQSARARILHASGGWFLERLNRGPFGSGTALLPPDLRPVEPWLQDTFRVSSPNLLVASLLRSPEQAAVSCLWKACSARSAPFHLPAPQRPPRWPRDALLAAGGEDPDHLVHPVLIQLAGAFLDRGLSQWPMPDREQGFLIAVRRVLGAGHAVRPSWLASLGLRLRSWESRKASAEQVISEVLEEIGIRPEEREEFLGATLQRLPGWAGMFHRLESSPLPTGRTDARVHLADFLAVRLCLDALALAEVARRLGYEGSLRELRGPTSSLPVRSEEVPGADHALAWPLFHLAQRVGLAAPDLLGFSQEAVGALLALLEEFSPDLRRRIWHEAYERHYREELLQGLQARRTVPPGRAMRAPRFQVVFCIDDRNESLRRHFEELDRAHETFGTAGFFNLAIAYQGIDDPSTFPLCPVVVSPRHVIEEVPAREDAALLQQRRLRQRGMGLASARFRWASGSLWSGALVSATGGILAAIPMLASVFAPRLAGRLRAAFHRWLLPAPRTYLTLPREGKEADEIASGFSIEEKVERVGTLLENIGMTRQFSSIVLLLGHDASSVNNPYFAAYSCGACGGRSGGPNARLFARMANHPEVRARLRARGIDIPDTTWFLGGVHDTTTDRVTLFETEAVPRERAAELVHLQEVLLEACRRNAHERCRRFASAPRRASPEKAHRHAEERAFDISQTRPELGHATNASCVIGRRALTRGLFLDRRTFLVSYDPFKDPSGAILERTLLAVGPVGAGINLEYFFSTVDNERLGAGTKLPHNVVGLFGVMNGASSDLRTGLPGQMIEIHEPVRLQLVVEATPERLEEILNRQPVLREMVDNAWVILISYHPISGVFHRRERAPGEWLPERRPPAVAHPGSPENRPPTRQHTVPRVTRSAQWYEGKDGLLPPALIDPLFLVTNHDT